MPSPITGRTAPFLSLVLVTAIWGVTFVQVKDAVAIYPLKRGGTHGSPTSPLLHGSLVQTAAWAPAGPSPAPPTRNARDRGAA
ncbi:MAG TPA: hypothetical protein VMT59_00425 [Gaiellaceae bacterium]|nr:hypothetical protein [Gaiellaceae bacterium]